MCTKSTAPQANKMQNNETNTTNVKNPKIQKYQIQKPKKLKIKKSNKSFFASKRRCEKFWIFEFLDCWIFAFVRCCLISVTDKWATCAFPCAVGGVSILYIYIYICIYGSSTRNRIHGLGNTLCTWIRGPLG